MGFLKRLYLLLITLVLIAAIVILLVSPQTLSSWSATIAEQSAIVRVVMAIIVGVILFVLTYLQVGPDRSAKASGLMMRASGAITEVSVESARERILKVVGAVSGVVNVEAQVKPVRGRADVELQVTVFGDDTELPSKQKEINRALNQVVDKQLGLQMAGHPRVKIQLNREEISKPVLASPGAPLPVLETPKAVSDVKPVTAVENHSEEKKSLLDWLGMSPASETDKSDDDTIHVVSSAAEDKMVDELTEMKPDEPVELTSQVDTESSPDDTKTPGVEE